MKTTKADLNLKLPEVVAQFCPSLHPAPQMSHHTRLVMTELPRPTSHYGAAVEYVPIREAAFEAGFVLQSYVCALQLLQPTSHAKAGR